MCVRVGGLGGGQNLCKEKEKSIYKSKRNKPRITNGTGNLKKEVSKRGKSAQLIRKNKINHFLNYERSG